MKTLFADWGYVNAKKNKNKKISWSMGHLKGLSVTRLIKALVTKTNAFG